MDYFAGDVITFETKKNKSIMSLLELKFITKLNN